jgi:hypothetical protein
MGISTSPDSVRLRALSCAAYFFLAMASYYILMPVREALFVHKSGYMNLLRVLPLAFLGMFVCFPLARRYRELAR